MVQIPLLNMDTSNNQPNTTTLRSSQPIASQATVLSQHIRDASDKTISAVARLDDLGLSTALSVSQPDCWSSR